MSLKKSLLARSWRRRFEGRKIAFISGNFNVVHAGHIRLFKFARELADVVLVGTNTDGTSGAVFPAQLRLEGIQGLGCVDAAGVLDAPLVDFLIQLKPDLVVKGKEHESRFNKEAEIVASYDGSLRFGANEFGYSTLDAIRRELEQEQATQGPRFSLPSDYASRHALNSGRLSRILKSFSDLSVTIIGDLIIDDYVTCDPLGMSQEDPTIVVTPMARETFVGGAGIVASHACGMGAKAHLVSIGGDDPARAYALEKLEKYGVDANIVATSDRPTTRKERFRANSKTLLRVNHLRQHQISTEIQAQLAKVAEQKIEQSQVLIFSDFSYGCLPQPLIDRLIEFARSKDAIVAADSQSSSQLGDIGRFQDADLLTPTEREARLALSDATDGLVQLANRLTDRLRAKNLIITLGAEGCLMQRGQDKEDKSLTTDRLPALNPTPVDVAGAGDSLLVTTALGLATGASIWEAGALGSIAAAHQVSRTGNVPLQASELAYLDE